MLPGFKNMLSGFKNMLFGFKICCLALKHAAWITKLGCQFRGLGEPIHSRGKDIDFPRGTLVGYSNATSIFGCGITASNTLYEVQSRGDVL